VRPGDDVKGISVLALLLAAGIPAFGAALRSSAVKVDITPDTPQWLMGYNARQSTGVHDKIFHRIVALDDGATQFYLVASDLCLFSPSVYDEAAQRLSKELGIPPGHMWWSVTHSHATPEVGAPGMYKALLGRSDHEWNRDYAAKVIDALVEGVKSAKARLEPARVAVGQGMSMANINRRARDVDGRVSLGLNPDGATDRQIGLIRLERPDGSPIAVIANYAMHGTVLSGANLEIGGDAPGTVSAYVEQKVGAPVLYVQGAAGNMAPIYSGYPNPRSGHLSEFDVLLGDRILAALGSIGPATGDASLELGEKTIETPRKEGLDWPEELAMYSRDRTSGGPLVRLPLHFLRIDHTLIWSAPVELFCEVAVAVRNQSPFPHTFYFGYTGGWFGYLPTRQGFQEGGYEPRTSPFTESAEKDLLQGVISYIQGLPR
jgi:neutral ceramidase